MAVNANTVETYDNVVIREDLREQYYMISPEEVPFQQAIGVGQDATNTLHEWPILDLATPQSDNTVIEGEEAPAVDPGTLADRRANVCQISDKVVSVSHTSEAVDAAAQDVQKMTKQMAIKLRELKRDMETMLLLNVGASLGASNTARRTAGLPAFITTNVLAGAGGTNPTLSDPPNGYPNAGAGAGTLRDLTEDLLNELSQDVWEAGGNPTMAMVNANNKRIISETFTGNATLYKDRIDKSLTNAVDAYVSDFGEYLIVPNRFQPTLDRTPGGVENTNFALYLIDPDFAEVNFLDPMKNKELAETGHAYRRLIWGEYCLSVLNEAAMGIIRDLNGTFPTP